MIGITEVGIEQRQAHNEFGEVKLHLTLETYPSARINWASIHSALMHHDMTSFLLHMLEATTGHRYVRSGAEVPSIPERSSEPGVTGRRRIDVG